MRCPGCSNLHLIADNMGMFENPGWNIEQVMDKHRGEVDASSSENILEFVKKS